MKSLQLYFYPVSWMLRTKVRHIPLRLCVCACACTLTSSVAQSCSTLCDSVDYSPLSSSVHRVFQARILEQVAISYSRGSSWPKDWTRISPVSCTGRWILYHWATQETAHISTIHLFCGFHFFLKKSFIFL